MLVVGFPIDEGVLSFQQLHDEAIVWPQSIQRSNMGPYAHGHCETWGDSLAFAESQ